MMHIVKCFGYVKIDIRHKALYEKLTVVVEFIVELFGRNPDWFRFTNSLAARCL